MAAEVESASDALTYEQLPRIAPESMAWVCPACGRTAMDRHRMRDISCIIWSVLCWAKPTGKDEQGKLCYQAVSVEELEEALQ